VSGNKLQETVLYSESLEKREYAEPHNTVINLEKATPAEKIKEEFIPKAEGKSYNYDNLALSPSPQASSADKKNTAAYKILFGPVETEKKEEKSDEKNVEPSSIEVKIKDEPKNEASSSPFQLTINDALPKKENSAQNINIADKPVFEQIIKEKPSYNTDIITEKPFSGEIPRNEIKLSQNFNPKPRREVDPVQMKPLSEEQILTNNVQYRPALDELFGSTLPRVPRESVTSVYDTPAPAVNVSGGASYNGLKAKLKTEGYMLRPYSRTSAVSHYLTGFIYNNQINRDAVTVMYLLLAVQIMGIYFLADSILNLGLKAYLTLASALILVPISFWIIYAVNPNKRIKAKFNFKVSILTSLMIFFNLLVVIMLAGFFIFHADISEFSTMILPVFVPAILILNIPLASIIYGILYNTRQYHLKN
jgi:uncharacterized membrane protein YwzB